MTAGKIEVISSKQLLYSLILGTMSLANVIGRKNEQLAVVGFITVAVSSFVPCFTTSISRCFAQPL